jgi:hypothetical protein
MKNRIRALVPAVPIDSLIYIIRGQKVILDADLAAIYGVTTKALNQAVKRNPDRFPADFLFHLTSPEIRTLELNRSQFVTGSQRHRDPRYRPYAFTEHGAIMAANVLRSRQALQTSVFVVRAFIRTREVLTATAHLSQKLAELERKIAGHDGDIQQIVKTIRQLLSPPEPQRKPIGFHVREGRTTYRTARKLHRGFVQYFNAHGLGLMESTEWR